MSIITKLLTNNKIILLLIIINSMVVFISGFNYEGIPYKTLFFIDNVITSIFLLEVIVKIKKYGKHYFASKWNTFDFILIVVSLPSLISLFHNINFSDYDFILVLRTLRVFKALRFFKFIPGIDHLIYGTNRAIRSSIFVLFGFMIYVFVVGIINFTLYCENSPEHFGNPLLAIYTTFKLFTVEGWFEILEAVASKISSTIFILLTHFYFVFIVLTGGLFGLSLVNSIFVDAMLNDDNNDISSKITQLEKKIDLLLKEKKYKSSLNSSE